MRSNSSTYDRSSIAAGSELDLGLKSHMEKVYGLMAVAMLLTGAVAWATAGLAMNETGLTGLGVLLYATPLKWVLMFAPLALVLWLSFGMNRMSAAATQTFFYGFAALMGLSMSSIFIVFTGVSIAQTFLITAIAFASLSIYGYTTKRDLAPMGAFLIMGVVGLIVAMVLNIFIASSALQMTISIIGLFIFAALTAYDTQRIKSDYLAYASAGDTEWLQKAAVSGALSLYLDFINMFQFLLNFMGDTD